MIEPKIRMWACGYAVATMVTCEVVSVHKRPPGRRDLPVRLVILVDAAQRDAIFDFENREVVFRYVDANGDAWAGLISKVSKVTLSRMADDLDAYFATLDLGRVVVRKRLHGRGLEDALDAYFATLDLDATLPSFPTFAIPGAFG